MAVGAVGEGLQAQVNLPTKSCPRDYHSLRSKARRAADETNGSCTSPISVQALFIASVTFSGAWRAKYSLSASLNKRLPDFLVLRAKCSAASKTSSGIDTAVFIP